ncbi:MAG TPA: STAS domain-containing protein [Myxococcaceae bacterium]|jgi:rsbT antagonist protein RsbS|nr:STAS domain-containing protein [Myxococcaceae bacterium]
MTVPILKQGDTLIASFQSDPTDAELTQMQRELSRKVGELRARGVILDVSLLDVIDSFAARTLATIAASLRLRGATTVLVGIQPEVAFSMVQLGVTLPNIHTALDLEEGLELLRGG